MRLRWWLPIGIAAMAAAVATALAVGGGGGDRSRLVMEEPFPADLRELAVATFGSFEASFPARLECMDDVRLVPVWEGMDDRARYLPGESTIELRVPATANLLADSLVHEFAHHLDVTCPEQRAFRPAFLAAQGHVPGTDWAIGPTWEETPAEQFAEAVVLVVLGGRRQHTLTMPIADDAVDLVAAWGRGEG
jgi:hypothetical protein